jgi:hypothetical protein
VSHASLLGRRSYDSAAKFRPMIDACQIPHHEHSSTARVDRTVTSAEGRVVKLIGDEVLYTASDEASACTIALNLATTFTDRPIVPAVRAGVAGGDVLLRDGDVFGPVVNLAARAVKVAAAGEVVAPVAVAQPRASERRCWAGNSSKASTTTSSYAGCSRPDPRSPLIPASGGCHPSATAANKKHCKNKK